MLEQPTIGQATTIAEVVERIDGRKPLNYGAPDWDAYHVETGRNNIDRLIRTFLRKGIGHKALFGGHAGNGKSTELNRFKGDEQIKERFLIIGADVAEILNPFDLEIVELLLLIAVETLDQAEKNGYPFEASIRERFEELEGVFRGELEVTSEREQKRESSAELSASASAGYPGWFVKLKASFMAKVKVQSDYRAKVRTTLKPRLNNLVELLDDLFRELAVHAGRAPMVVLDGLDRMSVESARKLYAEDSTLLGQINYAAMLLTVPVSVIHAPESARAEANLGKIHVFKNLRLHNREEKEDKTSTENKQRLREFLFKRMDETLIEPEALDKAIKYSGGVFRTLLDIISEAAVVADTDEAERIGSEEMGEALRDFKINKSRSLSNDHWRVLDEIAQTKAIQTGKYDVVRLELLHGLFALEYINGEEWYEINPLLEDGLARYREVMAFRKRKENDA